MLSNRLALPKIKIQPIVFKQKSPSPHNSPTNKSIADQPLNHQQNHSQNHQQPHHQKSLKQLILTKPKYNLIQKIQSRLISQYNIKVCDKEMFYLACYLSHYQTINTLINIKKHQQENCSTVRHRNIQKHQLLSCQSRIKNSIYHQQGNKNSKNMNKSRLVVPQILQTQRFKQTNDLLHAVTQSYRCRCLQEFFQISKYQKNNIINTIVNKIHQKVTKGQIKTVDMFASSRRVSIFNHHRRQISDPQRLQNMPYTKIGKQNKVELNINKQKHNLSANKEKKLFPKIQVRSKDVNLVKSPQKNHIINHSKSPLKGPTNRNHIFNQINFIQPPHPSPITTLKSFKGQSRRHGIHEVNKILTQLEELKKSLSNNQSQGYEVMKIASNLKHHLNNLIGSLRVKNFTPTGVQKDDKKKDLTHHGHGMR